MAQVCTVCGYEVGDQAQLCPPCTGLLGANLRDLPDLAADLEVTLARQHRFALASDGARTTERPLDFDERAGDTLRKLRDMLRRWAEQFTGAEPAATDVPIPALARTLANILTVIRQHEAAGAFAQACLDAVRECRRVIDRPSERLYIGPCGMEDGDEALCKEELYARPHADVVRCPACGAEHSADERRSMLLSRVEDEIVTYGEACSALPGLMDQPLNVNTVKSWVRRDHLEIKGYLHKREPRDRDIVVQQRQHPHDSPLVRVGDVIRLVFRGTKAKSAA